MNQLLSLLINSGSMQKPEILKRLNLAGYEFDNLADQLKQDQMIVEVGPGLYAATSKGKNEMDKQKQKRMDEKKRQQEVRARAAKKMLERRQREEKLDEMAMLRNTISNLETKVGNLTRENISLKAQLKVAEDKIAAFQKKNDQPNTVTTRRVGSSRQAPSSRISTKDSELNMWLDLGQMENERLIISGESQPPYDPTYDRASDMYMDDDERYMQRVRDGEE